MIPMPIFDMDGMRRVTVRSGEIEYFRILPNGRWFIRAYHFVNMHWGES
ncbi:MAG: hypothetical protein WC683_09375 [bacterium]|jgi:hypothetical protein